MQDGRLRRKDHSTVRKDEYIWDHIKFGALFGFYLYMLLPLVAPIAYYHHSLLRLIFCMVVASVFGIVLSYKSYRTNLGMMADILSGLGSYVVLTIGVYKPEVVKLLIIVSALMTAIGLYSLFTSKIKRPDKIKQIIWNRIHRGFLLVRRNAGVTCAFALIVIPVSIHFTSNDKILAKYYDVSGIDTTTYSFEYEVVQAYDDRYRLSENIDVIKKIRTNEEFQSLSYEEKCEVVTALVYCEARYIGLEEVNLEFKELRDSTLGKYNHSTRTITLNSKPLKDGTLPGGSNEEIMRCVFHEARHYYQHLLAESYIAATPEQRNLYAYTSEGVAEWIKNFKNYKSVEDEYDVEEYVAYAGQQIEIDANYWADCEIKTYFYYIDEELQSSNDE